MSDPIPEGYLSAEEAWLEFRRAIPGGYTGAAMAALKEAFARSEINAFVRFPGALDNMRIPAASWIEQFYSECVFLRPAIHPFDQPDPWATFAGRTPILREVEFKAWLSKATGENAARLAARFDPLSLPHWNLAMAVVWIETRSTEQVRSECPEFREASVGERDGGSLALLAIKSPEVRNSEMALLQAFANGSLSLIGHNTVDGQIKLVPPIEWPTLKLGAGGEPAYRDQLYRADQRRGGSGPLYVDLYVTSAEVVRRWPPPKADVSDTAERPARVPYPIEELVAHLQLLARAWLGDKAPRVTTRSWYRTVAPKKFPGVSKSQCDAAWKQANLPPAWRERGAPRKSDST